MLRTALLLGGTGETGKQVGYWSYWHWINFVMERFLITLMCVLTPKWNIIFQLLKQLAADPSYNKVISVGRRKVVLSSVLLFLCFRLTCPLSPAWRKWCRRKSTLTTSLNTPLPFLGVLVSHFLAFKSFLSFQSWFRVHLSGHNKGKGWCWGVCEGVHILPNWKFQ